MKYALQVFIANLKAKIQTYGIFYDQKYDCKNDKEKKYVLKGQRFIPFGIRSPDINLIYICHIYKKLEKK